MIREAARTTALGVSIARQAGPDRDGELPREVYISLRRPDAYLCNRLEMSV